MFPPFMICPNLDLARKSNAKIAQLGVLLVGISGSAILPRILQHHNDATEVKRKEINRR